ncbi:Spermatogenesis-defective protein 39 [Orchesella cincta]|uniref:Spermatogenesis-defective protein 39 n=1 Tax=Orchesella cincta TaxID=48709 RepID=A0A1D2MKP0_ORCCI|nr:Spermatogenesis-defective protein 39 [Orchesella cincta]
MASNRIGVLDDDKWWNESTTKGFDFGDESDSIGEEDSTFFGGHHETATKINLELRAEVSSLRSFVSDGSSEDHSEIQRIRDLPAFLWSDTGTIEKELERSTISGSAPLAHDVISRDLGEGRLHIPQVDETIHQFLISSDAVILEPYKSYSQKRQLLSKAVEINDGNAILGVTIFLSKSLRPSLFRQLLMEYKPATEHYLRFLETRNEINHLVDLMNMLGRSKEALLMRYKQILRRAGGNLQNLLKELKHFNSAECQLCEEDVILFINQHLMLLDIQKEIKEKKDTLFPHAEYSSVLGTLGFVAEHFYENTTPTLNVDSIKQKFNLNGKQYAWVVLHALVKQQKWPQIETLLLTKSWLGGTKDKCLLPLEDVCFSLKEAPVDLISRFLRLIDDYDKRLTIARRLKCHMVVLDVYAAQKDRAAILTYRAHLEENSKEAVYADNTLKAGAIKWKN